ncbi:hypothetical protein BDZ89DRAFT_1053635 [Hymenopellis radicata]|nr:hypothetical protein BDZ89DRAFT_1053635 [Hymenopellis radicata]
MSNRSSYAKASSAYAVHVIWEHAGRGRERGYGPQQCLVIRGAQRPVGADNKTPTQSTWRLHLTIHSSSPAISRANTSLGLVVCATAPAAYACLARAYAGHPHKNGAVAKTSTNSPRVHLRMAATKYSTETNPRESSKLTSTPTRRAVIEYLDLSIEKLPIAEEVTKIVKTI